MSSHIHKTRSNEYLTTDAHRIDLFAHRLDPKRLSIQIENGFFNSHETGTKVEYGIIIEYPTQTVLDFSTGENIVNSLWNNDNFEHKETIFSTMEI